MSLEKFLRMNASERHQYITEHGLSEEERQELLQVNKIISSMLQQDSHYRSERKQFKHIIRFIISWLLR
jgi:hypothetical protein